MSNTRVSSKRYHLLSTHADSVVGSFEASSASILWGELFPEKERVFLRQFLEEGNVAFGAQDTFQLEYRIAWNPEVKKQVRTGMTDGKLVILLHGYSGRITNSWGWVKMVKSLWKQGFTVCLLDMPGFGRSSINLRWNVPVSSWQHMDSVIIGKFINNMNFRKPVSFIAYRESCASVLRLCRDSPHLVSQRQILVDPMFALDDIWPIEPPYGAQKEWFLAKPGKQAVEFDRLISKGSLQFWACFTGSPDTDTARDSLQAVIRARQHLSMRISMSHITKEFISEARAGATVTAELLFLCRYIKDRFTNFLAGTERAPKEIPPWALEVTSTNASSALGSKAVPSVDSPVGRARGFNALETVQEAAEVLSRCTTAVQEEDRPLSAVSIVEDIVPFEGTSTMSKRKLPMLPALQAPGNRSVASSKGFAEMRQTFRADDDFRARDRAKGHKPKQRSAVSLGMSRYGASFMQMKDTQKSFSEPKLQDPSLIGPLRTRAARSQVQRTAGGVAVCRSELPPPAFTTEASRCAINSCAQKALHQRIENPQNIRERLICPARIAREAVEATGYSASSSPSRSVQEVLADLRDVVPNL